MTQAPAVLRLLLAGLALGLALWGRPSPRPPVLLLPESSPRAAARFDPRLEQSFQAQLTADDVARGVWALALGGGLGVEQRRAMAPLARQGAQARQEVDRLRTQRRAHRAELRQAGMELSVALIERGWRPEERR